MTTYYSNNKVDNVDFIEAQDLEDIEAGFASVDSDKANKVSSATNGNLAGINASGDLTDSGKAPPSGTVVGTSDSQTLTNKTLTNCSANTQSANNNSTKLATTAYVDGAVGSENQLSEMNDVTLSSVGNDEVLAYDSGAGKWKNQTHSEAGIVSKVSAGSGLSGGGSGGDVSLAHADTSSQASVNNTGRTYIQDITLDGYGHITAIQSATDSDTTYSVGDGGLTQKNFTTTLKSKLDGVASGAEVNVRSDWSASSGDAQIINKPNVQYTSAIPNASTTTTGLMSSDDKSKLDGIEGGATADQSASQILSAIKTVDGTGSGLDADTVDGYHAADLMGSQTQLAELYRDPSDNKLKYRTGGSSIDPSDKKLEWWIGQGETFAITGNGHLMMTL